MQAAFRNGLRQPYRIAPRNLQMPLARRMAATAPHEMNNIPKPAVEVYSLFAIVAVVVSGGMWLAHQKIAHDKEVMITQPGCDSHFYDGHVFRIEVQPSVE